MKSTSPNAQHANDDSAEEDEVDPTFSIEQAAELNSIVEGLTSKEKLAVPNAWTSLPDWIGDDLPFDAASYFQIPDKENGEQDYLKAVLRQDFDASTLLLPQLAASDPDDWPVPAMRAYELSRERYRAFSALGNWVDEVDFSTPYPPEGEALLESFRGAIDGFNAAQQFESNFVHAPIDICTFNQLDHFPREVARLIGALSRGHQNSAKSIEYLKSGLKLGSDFSRLGSKWTNLSVLGGEFVLISDIADPIIGHSKDVGQLESLIEVLLAHGIRNPVKHVVENERNEYLTLRKLLHELQSETFLPREDSQELLSIPDDMPAALVAYKELIELGYYRPNPAEIERVLVEQAKGNAELVESVREIIKDSKNSPMSNSMEAMVLLPLFHASVSAMTDADYAQEVEILNDRYRDIEAATALPFPERVDAIELLGESWTVDDGWRDTKFFKWILPHDKVIRASLRSAIRIRAYICLAALRKWQLNHEDQMPATLSEALEAANVSPAEVVDPYSGKPFGILSATPLAVYSVGPDQKDDQGDHPLEIGTKRGGDVVIEIGQEW